MVMINIKSNLTTHRTVFTFGGYEAALIKASGWTRPTIDKTHMSLHSPKVRWGCRWRCRCRWRCKCRWRCRQTFAKWVVSLQVNPDNGKWRTCATAVWWRQFMDMTYGQLGASAHTLNKGYTLFKIYKFLVISVYQASFCFWVCTFKLDCKPKS